MSIANVLSPIGVDIFIFNPIYFPKIVKDYSVKMTDVTQRPIESYIGEPSEIVVQIECDSQTLSLIDSDSRYLILEEL